MEITINKPNAKEERIAKVASRQRSKNWRSIFQPFGHISKQTFIVMIIAQIIITIAAWQITSDGLIPKPGNVAAAFGQLLTSKTLLENILVSLALTLKAMLYSIIITLFFAYASVIPFF